MEQLQAIIPTYIGNIGNAIQLYFNDFTTTNYCSLDYCIGKIARNQLIGITEAKKLIKESLNITKNPSTCFKNETHCMIKVRKPITKDDGSCGLFSIDSIETIETGSLTLKSSEKITTLESEKSIEDKI